MIVTVNACGLSCPQPVMLAQKAISNGNFPIEISIDTVTSRENVCRMAIKQGCQVEVIPDGDEFKLLITR